MMKSGRRFHSRSSFKGCATILLVWLSACAMPTGSDQRAAAPISSPPRSHRAQNGTNVLIFSGASSWKSEVDALAAILIDHGIGYEELTSPELNVMPAEEIAKFSLIIVPGGDAPTLTASLTPATHAKLREAVQTRGVDYLGFCAGAWAAVAPAPTPGEDVSYGLGIVDGPLEQETSLGKQGKEFAIDRAEFPDGSRRNLLWYGGPITPDLPGGVVAKYADGTPAISQMWSKQGFVIVSGLHPAVNTAILGVLGLTDNEAIDPEFAWKLLDAGIRGIPLPAF